MPNPSTYPYRRFPTIQVGAADHAARGTDAVKQELHALCAGSSKTVVTVECYPGTDQAEILALFPHAELVIHADDLAILPAELDAKIEHELTDDPVFGIMTTWQMKNFYPEEALCAARGKIDAVTDGLVLVYGVGASLVERADITIYADITRWEIQLRFRKGQDNWHTAMHDLPQRAKYKRGYFAEWRWGDRIKDKLLPVFDYYLDTTSAGNPAIVPGTAYRDALSKAAAQPFRMVPYFDPGVWGGDWMKTHFDLPENGSNYAWSFDGVPEENSLLLDFGSCVVETPALNLVYAHPRELLGDRVHARFGKEFPIRFDMLDTMHGQNLSLQVHPLTEYIQSHFHMHYTQDESYYLLDAAGEAPCVYLGIKAGTKPEEMIDALQTAQNGGKPFPAEKFVNKIPVKKHDHLENTGRSDIGNAYDSVLAMLQLGLLVTSFLLLFVSVLGQINIGLSSLEQRTHELLIRRAIGASRANIVTLVLGTQLIISIFVCIASILLSLLIVEGISVLLPPDSPITAPSYPIFSAVIAVITSVIVALLGGLLPAIKAAKLEPALALR